MEQRVCLLCQQWEQLDPMAMDRQTQVVGHYLPNPSEIVQNLQAWQIMSLFS